MRTGVLLLVFAVGCAEIENSDTNSGMLSDDVAAAANAPDTNLQCPSVSAYGRAFGLKLSSLSVVTVAPAPDTNLKNPDYLVKLVANLALGVVVSLADTVFSVEDVAGNDGCSATDAATATTNQISLSVPYVTLSATTVRARASSSASADGVTASSAGSLVQNLRINGKSYPDITGSLTITVRDLILHTPLAEVRVLEEIPGDNTHNSASLQVNGLHVISYAAGTDLTVTHAETEAYATICVAP